MDFDRLRYLVTLARTGSVRGAAAALHVSPGAVSKAIARLEQELDLALIQPAGRGVELTADGHWLAERAAFVVGEHAALGAALRDRRERIPLFCIAAHDVFATWFAALVKRQYLPNVPLSLRERWPGEVESAVATRLSDAGITFLPVPTADVQHVEVARVRMGIFTRAGAFTGTDASDLPYAVASHPVKGAAGSYGPLDGWPVDGPVRTVIFSTSSLEARLEMARQGECAIVLPSFVAEHHNRRVHARNRLVEHDSRSIQRRWERRAYVVRPVVSSDDLDRQIDSLATAVRAFCASDT